MSSLRTHSRAASAIAFAVGLAVIVTSPIAQAAGYPPKRAPDFTLVDQRGKPFTLAQYRGRPIVLFFGYAHCPDVCPTILANLKRARDSVAHARDSVVALVTVDPRRDTAAELGRFVGEFDPDFIGLTGTDAQLDRVYRAYHVRIQNTIGDSGGYLVAHTAFVYYIDREGRLSGFGTWDDPQPVLDADLGKIASSRRAP
jgi:protein SCO1/2